MLGSWVDVEGVGGLRLHPEGQLERLDPRLELGLALARSRCSPVELGEQVELARAGLGPRRSGCWMFSISFSMSVCWVSM